MKKNLKVICGTLAGFILGGLTIAGANQAIQAIQNTEIKVSLNGTIQNFKDETTGEKQYPITYHDRTYLPLRNVAQLTGLNVDYDASSNTALLSTGSGTFSNKLDSYIIKDSDITLIDQVEYLSYDQLLFAKNEIFARYGYDFSSKKIRSYFDMQEWYKPVKGKNIKLEDLNEVEQKNVGILDDELNKRLTWVNNGNLIKDISMPTYAESFDIEYVLKENGIDVQKLSKGAYSYRVNGLKVGSDIYQAYIYFEINDISDYGYRQTSNSEFYLLKDSKIILDFSADGKWGSTSIDDIGDIYILGDYVINIKCGAGDACDMLICDKNGTYLFLDSGLAISVTMRRDGKLFEYKYDEYAGYLEGAIGDYNYYKSIYELYIKEGKMIKNRVGIDYTSVIYTAQT